MMKPLFIIISILFFGSIFALASWDIPAPEATREKIIPNDRFR